MIKQATANIEWMESRLVANYGSSADTFVQINSSIMQQHRSDQVTAKIAVGYRRRRFEQLKSGSEEISAGIFRLKVLEFTFILAFLISHRLEIIKITPDHKSVA